MRRTAFAAGAAALLACFVGAASASDSPTLVVNKQVGNIKLGELEAHVAYDYGSMCIAGCDGRKDGCVLGLTRCVGPAYKYMVQGGYLRVGFRERDALGRRVPG